MSRPRISIAGLIVLVVLAGIGFAAIKSGSRSWAGFLFTVTVYSMFGALLGIAFRRGPRRVFWFGFALFGWSYLYLNFFPPSNYRFLHGYFLAPNLFSEVYPLLNPTPDPEVPPLEPAIGPSGSMGGGFRSMMGGMGGMMGGPVVPMPTAEFLRIGSCLEALILALIGGFLAKFFYLDEGRRAGERPPEGEATTPPIPSPAP